MYCKIYIYYASLKTCLHHFLLTCPGAFIARISACSFPCDTCMSLIGSHVLLCNPLVMTGPWRSRPFILISCTFTTLFKVLYLIFESYVSYVNRSIDNLYYILNGLSKTKQPPKQWNSKKDSINCRVISHSNYGWGRFMAHIYCFL